MRKVFLAMLLILPFVFQSCKKNDVDKTSLVGSEWYHNDVNSIEKTEQLLKFLDAQRVQVRVFVKDVETQTENGTYTVSGSKVTMVFSDGTYTGTIAGNKLTVEHKMEGEPAVRPTIFERK